MRKIALLLFIVLTSCKKRESFFCTPDNKKPNIKYQSIDFESYRFDSIHTSYSGLTLQKEDRLLFVDRVFMWVYEFDRNGDLLQRHLGRGNSSRELPMGNIEVAAITQDNDIIFLGATNEWIVVDSSFRRKEQTKRMLGMKLGITDKGMYDQVEGIYAFLDEKYTFKSYGDNVYIAIVADSEMLNILTPDFATQARVLARIDANKMEIVKVLGRHTPELAKSEGNAFPYFTFDIDRSNGDFYLTYELDSLIYVYDKNFNIKSSFGYSGKDMDRNYNMVEMDNFRAEYPLQRMKKGYYDRVSLVNGKVFRSYKKGTHSQYDGLQIYEDGVLIADVETPKGVEIAAYIEPYYYSAFICDEAREEISSYKFKLEK